MVIKLWAFAAPLLKSGGESMVRGIQTALSRSLVPFPAEMRGENGSLSNRRGVALLSIPGKVLASIPLGLIKNYILRRWKS